MATRKKVATRKKRPRRILVLDVGGSHVKFQIGDRGREQKFSSGPGMTPKRMIKGVRQLVSPADYDAVSIGYPGLVFRGRIAAEPFNLGRGWVGFDFEAALEKPVRILNDAAMQAVGSYTGGRMLFLGLGTGMGATLILDGVVEPMEIGHLPYKRSRTFEDYVGQHGLEHLGRKKWRKRVVEVVEHLSRALEVRDGGRVTGSIKTVNGSLNVENGVDVAGDVRNINGEIHIEAAHVGGSVKTVTGNIDLGPGAHIDGDVVVKHGSGYYDIDRHAPRVVIGPDTVVKGDLRFERNVTLYVSDRATIGQVEGAEVVKFSGAHPPG